MKFAIWLFIFIFIVAGSYVILSVELPYWSPAVSAVSIILTACPAIWAAARWLGRRDAFILFAGLAILGLTIETFAIITGAPYGHFGYSDLLGHQLFGYTPWTVAFAWPPLVLAAYAVSGSILSGPVFRVAAAAIILTAADLVLDPGAVRLGFWQYDSGGAFYGVPLSNFAGWLLSGALGALLLEAFVYWRKPLLPIPSQLVLSGLLSLVFWTAIATFSGMAAPAVLGACLTVGLAVFYTKYHYAFDDMIVIVDEDNNPIRTERKLKAHDHDTALHRAFSVFLFNQQGELLLQQRALAKKTWPGVWSNSCCGHVMLHEKVKSAAQRRLRHELGYRGIELFEILPDFRYRAEKDGVVENEICPVFIGFTNDQPNPHSEEVNDYRWMDWNSFLEEIRSGQSGYSPWAVEEVELLAVDQEFCRLFEANTEQALDHQVKMAA